MTLTLDRQNAYRDRLRHLWPGWRPATEVYAATVRGYLFPGARLLDAGCGRGGLVEQIAAAPVALVGIDPDRASLADHRLPADRLARAAARLEATPFPAATFDLVMASWVLEHLGEPAAAWRELARVLRPGGHLVLLTPNLHHPITWLNRLLARSKPVQARLVPRLYGRAEDDAFPVRYRANTVAGVRHLAAASGLAPVALRTVADPTYLAFNDRLFALACRLERLLPPAAGVHIVADLVRQ